MNIKNNKKLLKKRKWLYWLRGKWWKKWWTKIKKVINKLKSISLVSVRLDKKDLKNKSFLLKMILWKKYSVNWTLWVRFNTKWPKQKNIWFFDAVIAQNFHTGSNQHKLVAVCFLSLLIKIILRISTLIYNEKHINVKHQKYIKH